MDIILIKILKILTSSLACFVVFSGIGGCQDKVASPSVGPKHGEFVSLTITGYNYTNKYIDEFFVDGNGGLNLFVSSATSGGGGSVRCVKYIIGATLWKPEIRWQVGGAPTTAVRIGMVRAFLIYIISIRKWKRPST